MFDHCHAGLLNAHRPQDQTFHLLRRMGHWSTLAKDVDKWCAECVVCMRFRSTRLATGPLKSILGDEEHAGKLPWTDVILDCMGPFTKADIKSYELKYDVNHDLCDLPAS